MGEVPHESILDGAPCVLEAIMWTTLFLLGQVYTLIGVEVLVGMIRFEVCVDSTLA